ncbi:hypothetical protein B0H11DRAFT_1925706 [Mycena galericulata]|nr:hypothetical protein B0H11DRAFT_1925706 [Mycena galericulata]
MAPKATPKTGPTPRPFAPTVSMALCPKRAAQPGALDMPQEKRSHEQTQKDKQAEDDKKSQAAAKKKQGIANVAAIENKTAASTPVPPFGRYGDGQVREGIIVGQRNMNNKPDGHQTNILKPGKEATVGRAQTDFWLPPSSNAMGPESSRSATFKMSSMLLHREWIEQLAVRWLTPPVVDVLERGPL